MGKDKIAIVNSSSFGKVFKNHIEELEQLGEVKHFTFEQEIAGKDLAEALEGFNIIISSVTPFFTKEFFDHKDELKLISRHGIGYNNIDLEAAAEHNTIVSIIPALVERDAVAENNIANLMNILRRTSSAQQRVKDNKWEDRAQFVGNTLYNKTVGVIGIGNTGSLVAETVRNGFRCNVLAYDPYKSKLDIEQFGAKKVDFETLLKEADVICLCANLTDENYHMIAEDEVAMMKDNVYISNSARGALVKEEAIVGGLASGKIAGFATDVLEEEPGRSNHPYLQFENVVVTPHTSAYTMECLEAMGDKCVADVQDIVVGKLPGRSVQPISTYVTQ
ncbi:D-isomer specific 2-hydroxyacid dehydrogenase family protein [Fundicoccus culcitae]|uniref:D-isomer specific 2-hydroxyacid dehydrogenase family protein n=1 Tax=Fundicoccus culcitae TaxID=2969821 RepID=A0ABY5P403_9LACT|nr:D-isomer specific 2-hydroxyacid dehydrogenase family protein [Fundicoccus culcitae]UUX33409.1 D-isomer specific 2-hydroxyacid dehydrogenase family protein [Fundicoccus culcitae]